MDDRVNLADIERRSRYYRWMQYLVERAEENAFNLIENNQIDLTDVEVWNAQEVQQRGHRHMG